MQDMIDKLKPSWKYRRIYVAVTLVFAALMIVAALSGALALSAFAKFGLYISAFLIVFVICSFVVLLGVIGSYIFGARWETKDFLNILPNIIPQLGAKIDVESTTSDIQDMIDQHDSAGQ
jgi:hypothetical protein